MHEIPHRDGNLITVRIWEKSVEAHDQRVLLVGKKKWQECPGRIAPWFVREIVRSFGLHDLREAERWMRAG
ncbi:MAG TPA: hypothetical protein VGI60_02275 [Chthoniobacterales bacterium]|jgi:hypothetical protein